MFSKILIANRGEIAVRIIRACKEMGIATVAVYSDADADALHVALADESCCIGKAEPADSYLNEGRIISAALATGAKAIHPGYGFLSENDHFAALCRKNGLVFIGPTVENMEQLSDKADIKRRMAEAGLNPIPGTGTLSSVQEALEAAAAIGYPVMLKARSGGGGRGIRLVHAPEELETAFAQAEAESAAAFGDRGVYLENTSIPPAMWSCRCWPTSRAMPSAWGSGTAPSSGGTRSFWRRHHPRRSGRRNGQPSWPRRRRLCGRSATWAWAPWNSSWIRRVISGLWR